MIPGKDHIQKAQDFVRLWTNPSLEGKTMLHKPGNLIIVVLLLVPLLLNGCSGSPGGDAIAPNGEVNTDNTDDTVNVSVRDNRVIFHLSGFDTSTMTFAETGHNITDGQPWGSVTTDASDSNTFVIDVKCGRKGSQGPLEWFKEQVHGGGILPAQGYQTYPSSMNFALTGVLSIDGNNYTFCLGQYGAGIGNIWYIGGADFTQTEKPMETISTPDGKYTFGIYNSNNSFSLTRN